MTALRIPFLDLRGDADAERTEAAIRRVIDRGWFVLGPEVQAFEREFAEASSVAHAVGTGNGTDAIALLLRGLRIGRGDEVITSPLSAVFTAIAIMMVGARPVFADVDAGRLTLDPDAVDALVGPRTAAILPVHLYGQPADMPALMRVAERHGLVVVEDCCQAHLATCAGRAIGTFGAGAAFSFYPTKNLGGVGDGGAACTGDAALADRLRCLRNGGRSGQDAHEIAGVNSRLDEIQAAVLRTRLERLRTATSRRRVLAGRYRERLADSPVRVPPEYDQGHVYHLFPVLTSERDALRVHLASAGIETLIHYAVPITRQPAVEPEAPAPCPIAETVCRRVISLPLHPTLSERDTNTVAAAVRSFSMDAAP